MPDDNRITVCEYLLARLKAFGVDHVFGIPGDFILPFFRHMEGSDMTHIAACNELNAGYAADGYARIRGLAAVAATYGPGAFSLVNAAAGALAERVPVLFISGGPERSSYESQPLLHHTLPGKYDASVNIFEQITVHAKVLRDAEQATADIDEAFRVCLTEKKPVYLEIPRDIQNALCAPPEPLTIAPGVSDSKALAAAVETVGERIERGARSVILPGHEIHREKLQDKIIRLATEKGIDVGSLFIGKADYIEHMPECIGLYQGAGSLPQVKQYVEDADNVIFLGAVPSDFNLGGFTDDLTDTQTICVLENQVSVSGQVFDNVYIKDFVDGLLARLPENRGSNRKKPLHGFIHKADNPYEARHEEPMTNKRFYDRMAHFIKAGDVICTDAGCAVNSSHIQLPANVTYVASCHWASIGMGFGAAMGACFAATDQNRVVALEGDGSFQMTAQELSSMARYGKTAIVFVVNNKGYTAERLIHDGAFNDIADWKYHKLPEAFGGKGMDVHTEEDLEEALAVADSYQGPGPLMIEVHIDPWDASEAFTLMSEKLRGH
jgi:TPP-dependent 2-oxoacid decarboxylase